MVQPAPAIATTPQTIIDQYGMKIERNVYRDQKGRFIEHGPWTAYGYNGQKVGGGNMINGLRDGYWYRVFQRGEAPLFQTEPLANHQGPYTSEATFVNGQLHGQWTIKNGQGAVAASWTFQNGLQFGPFQWFHPSGKPEYSANYVNGKLHGLVEIYGQNGQLSEKQEYVDGRQLQTKTFSFQGGVHSCDGIYLLAKERLHTSYDFWYGKANTLFYGYDGAPQKHGLFKWYYPNGAIKTEGAFAFGKEVGNWTFYSQAGAIEKQVAMAATPELPASEVNRIVNLQPVSNQVAQAQGQQVALASGRTPPANGAPGAGAAPAAQGPAGAPGVAGAPPANPAPSAVVGQNAGTTPPPPPAGTPAAPANPPAAPANANVAPPAAPPAGTPAAPAAAPPAAPAAPGAVPAVPGNAVATPAAPPAAPVAAPAAGTPAAKFLQPDDEPAKTAQGISPDGPKPAAPAIEKGSAIAPTAPTPPQLAQINKARGVTTDDVP